MAQILRLIPPPALLPHEVGGKAPAKAVLVHHPDLPWDQSTQMRRISLWWLIVRSLHKNCPWLKEAVSPKFTPTPLLVNVGDTKSWPPCFNWDNPAGTFQLQSSWLAETSVATASQFSFSPCPILLPSCSQALFQRALLNQPPARESLGLTMSFIGKPTWDARSSSGMGFLSWTTHWPDGNEPMKCDSHAIVKTFTRRELGGGNGEREYTEKGNTLAEAIS